jgi:hypothetical protein
MTQGGPASGTGVVDEPNSVLLNGRWWWVVPMEVRLRVEWNAIDNAAVTANGRNTAGVDDGRNKNTSSPNSRGIK